VGKGYSYDGMFKLDINKIPILLIVEDDPKTYKDAIISQDVGFWKETVND
jgi:hypothetical protein